MVEVFKTNITNRAQAERLVTCIHRTFRGYKANFDLQDCDRILRVESNEGFVHSLILILFLKNLGCMAQVLSDEIQPDTLILQAREFSSR